jgi:hypothetical protein
LDGVGSTRRAAGPKEAPIPTTALHRLRGVCRLLGYLRCRISNGTDIRPTVRSKEGIALGNNDVLFFLRISIFLRTLEGTNPFTVCHSLGNETLCTKVLFIAAFLALLIKPKSAAEDDVVQK